MEELEGRVAVVTGAASGIGRALARRLGAEGMRVMLSDVEPGALEEAAAALRATGAECDAALADVSRADAVAELAERTLEAIRSDRFYVLAPEGSPWRTACRLRLEDIGAARNPTLPDFTGAAEPAE